MGKFFNTCIGMLACIAAASSASASLVPLTPDAHTVGLYHLDGYDGSGGTVYSSGTALVDSSVNNTLAKIGVSTRSYTSTVAAGFGTALRGDSGVYLPSLSESILKSDFTMDMWVRTGGTLISTSTGKFLASYRMFTCRGSSIGWIIEVASDSSGNKIRVHNGSSWSAYTTITAALPTTEWSHWAAVFDNLNPDSSDSSYSMSLYGTASDATAGNLLATVTFNPNLSTTSLTNQPLAWNTDQNGGYTFGSSSNVPGIDELRLSDSARTTFEYFQTPEPATTAFLGLGGLVLAARAAGRRRRPCRG